MPELPEVEVVRAGLAPYVTGTRVLGAEVVDARALRGPLADSDLFEREVLGAVMLEPRRRGKFLWVPFAPDAGAAPGGAERALSVHLGMTGQLRIADPGDPLGPHTRVRFWLERDGIEHELRFVDQRLFGGVQVRPLTASGVPEGVEHIAPDPLEQSFDAELVARALRRRRQGVKAALLDQQLVSGIGNIYADEALWRSRLHYLTPGERLSRPRALELLGHVQAVMEEALTEGGTSFDSTYVHVNGASGYFSRSLKAYGQAGKPCERCGTPLVREAWAGRSSHRCPRCQRRPRGIQAP